MKNYLIGLFVLIIFGLTYTASTGIRNEKNTVQQDYSLALLTTSGGFKTNFGFVTAKGKKFVKLNSELDHLFTWTLESNLQESLLNAVEGLESEIYGITNKKLIKISKDSKLLWSASGNFKPIIDFYENKIISISKISKNFSIANTAMPILDDLLQIYNSDGVIVHKIELGEVLREYLSPKQVRNYFSEYQQAVIDSENNKNLDTLLAVKSVKFLNSKIYPDSILITSARFGLVVIYNYITQKIIMSLEIPIERYGITTDSCLQGENLYFSLRKNNGMSIDLLSYQLQTKLIKSVPGDLEKNTYLTIGDLKLSCLDSNKLALTIPHQNQLIIFNQSGEILSELKQINFNNVVQDYFEYRILN